MNNPSVTDITGRSEGECLLQPEHWVDRYAEYLYGFALSRLNEEETARDLVQETFLSALENAATFRGNSSEQTWLSAIIKYKIIDRYRKRSRAFQAGNTAADQEQDFFDPETHHWKPEYYPQPFAVEEQDPLQHKELKHVLQLCLQQLPQLWRAAFNLKHMDEERTEDICKELRITTANYWVIMHRAKVNLRACLQKNWI